MVHIGDDLTKMNPYYRLFEKERGFWTDRRRSGSAEMLWDSTNHLGYSIIKHNLGIPSSQNWNINFYFKTKCMFIAKTDSTNTSIYHVDNWWDSDHEMPNTLRQMEIRKPYQVRLRFTQGAWDHWNLLESWWQVLLFCKLYPLLSNILIFSTLEIHFQRHFRMELRKAKLKSYRLSSISRYFANPRKNLMMINPLLKLWIWSTIWKVELTLHILIKVYCLVELCPSASLYDPPGGFL